jgi:hypothetical protein
VALVAHLGRSEPVEGSAVNTTSGSCLRALHTCQGHALCFCLCFAPGYEDGTTLRNVCKRIAGHSVSFVHVHRLDTQNSSPLVVPGSIHVLPRHSHECLHHLLFAYSSGVGEVCSSESQPTSGEVRSGRPHF